MSTISDITYKLLIIKHATQVGNGKILKHIHDIKSATPLEILSYIKRLPPSSSILKSEIQECEKAAKLDVINARKLNFKFLSILDDDIPKNILCQNLVKEVLFAYKGEIPANITNSVAVLGNKKHTDIAGKITEKITKFLVSKDFVVVSGLDRGIQEIAHDTALRLGGNTVGILSCGLGMISKLPTLGTANKIIKSNNLLISLFNYDIQPNLMNFDRRNFFIAAISKAAIMTEVNLGDLSLQIGAKVMCMDRPLFSVVPLQNQFYENANYCSQSKILAYPSLKFEDKMEIFKLDEKHKDALNNLYYLRNYNDYPDFLRIVNSVKNSSSLLPEEEFCMFD